MRSYIILVLLLFCLNVYAQQNVLDKKITIEYKKERVEKILIDLQEKHKLRFSYSSSVVPLDKKISISARDKQLKDVLDLIFKNEEVGYQVIDNQIVLKKAPLKKKANHSMESLEKNLMLTASLSPEIILDTSYNRNIVLLNDSIKFLKVEISRLGKMVDSLIVTMENPQQNLSDSLNSRILIKEKNLKDKLNDELNILNIKVNQLVEKLKVEAGHLKNKGLLSSSGLKDTYYFILVNIVPPDFKFPLIGFLNVARGRYEGVNLGFINTVNGDFDGIQGGFLNLKNGHTRGATFGFINLSTGSINGANFGFINLNANSFKGARFGYINGNYGNFEGADFGFVNVNKGNFKGGRFGFVNIATNASSGTAFGFVNVAKTMNGLHIGFINICDTIEKGIPIGFLSFVKKGYMKFEAGVSESLYPLVSFKIGVKQFYNIFSVGGNYSGGTFRFGVGYGVGTLVQLKPSSTLNFDLVAYEILERGHNYEQDGVNLLNSLKINYARNLNDKLSFFVGPSFNVLVSNIKNKNNTYGSQIATWNIFNETYNQTNIKMWPGINAGLRF